MSEKLQQSAKNVKGFLSEVGSEFRRTTWPDRRELVESTVVVITFIVLLAAVVLACDQVINFLLTPIQA